MPKKHGPIQPTPRPMGSNPASGRNNADEHYQELVGSSGFWIYLTPKIKVVGLERLKKQVEESGCTIDFALDAPVNLGPAYQQLKIWPVHVQLIPEDLLKQAHRWAHRHDFLHSFFKPTFPGL